MNEENAESQTPARPTVFVVTKETGEYSDRWTSVVAVFTNRAAAERYAAASDRKVFWPHESEPGRHEVEEAPLWDDAPVLVTRWNKFALVHRNRGLDRQDVQPPYRVSEYYPADWQADLYSRTRVSEQDPNWADIEVRAATAEECWQEFTCRVEAWRVRGVE